MCGLSPLLVAWAPALALPLLFVSSQSPPSCFALQLLLQRVMASMWLPPGAILQWLDMHSQFRLSILLTYLFGKSEAFVQLMRWAGNVARVRAAARDSLLTARPCAWLPGV